ncbi:MAG: hypothetical protein PWP23_2604 [Candidatus Sumerlaeota bacterium]|nr:hypothetical protein [Candidatus Sumerlaeota bacterium]
MAENEKHDGGEDSPHVKFALLEREVTEMKKYLYGNGRPGKLAVIETKIDTLSDKMGRVQLLIGILATSSGAGIGYVLKAMFGG